MNADGTSPRLIAEQDVPGAVLQTPLWSPDSASLYVSYQAQRSNGGLDVGIDRLDVASGARTRVVPNAMPCTGLPPSSYAKRILPPAVWLRPPLHFGKLRHSPAELFGRTELRHQVSPQQVQREWLADDLRAEAQHVHVVVLDTLVR